MEQTTMPIAPAGCVAVTTNVIEHFQSVRTNRKEKRFYSQITLINLDIQACEYVDKEHVAIRTYGDRGQYACIWYYNHKTGKMASAGAHAKRCEFRYDQAAVELAFKRMHIQLSQAVDGVGIPNALHAIARADGLTNYLIHEAHG